MKKLFSSFMLVAALLCWGAAPDSFAKNKSDKEEKEVKLKAPKAAGQKVLEMVWARGLKGGASKKSYFPEWGSPDLASGSVFVGTHGKMFYAVDAESGKIKWSAKTEGPVASQPITNSDHVFFGDNKGYVYGLDAATGAESWKVFLGAEVINQSQLCGNTVYVLTTRHEVHALRVSDGSDAWHSYIKGVDRPITVRGNSSLVCDGARLYAGFDDGRVAALSTADGSVLWATSLAKSNSPFKDVDAKVVVDGGALFAISYSGALAKLEKNTGNVLWQKEAQGGNDLGIDVSRIYVTDFEGRVEAFDKGTGLRRWDIQLASGVLSAPAVLGDKIVVGTGTGKVFVINADSGALLQELSGAGGFLGSAAAESNRLFYLSTNAQLVSLKMR